MTEAEKELVKKRVHEHWTEYKEVLSDNAGAVQIKETKQAFYCGMFVMSQVMQCLAGVDDDDALDEQSDYTKRFEQAMDDDFNTPMAISVLFDMSHELNRLKTVDRAQAGILAAQLKKLAELLGLLENNAQQFLQGSSSEGGLADDDINLLIEQRATAKQEKNWSECDRIRDVLDAEDILLEDTAQGTRWRRK